MEIKLTKLQAFNAMREFLEICYNQGLADDFAVLLSDTQLFPDGGTWDPAAWEDWIDSISTILKNNEENLTKLQAFNAMRRFLEIYYEQTSSSDVGSILRDSKILPDGGTFVPVVWSNWTQCVDTVLKETSE